MRQRRLAIGVLVCAAWLETVSAAPTQSAPGEASISGVVITTGDSPAPIARALITISGSSLKPSRTAVSDNDGRFTFAGLTSGSFTIVATKPPFVPTAFGAKRPGRPGTPINLVSGQRVVDVAIRLARGAAITGAIRHASGEPAAGVKVDATPLDLQARPLSASVTTDDRGVYRVFGLPPGKYIVTAGATDSSANALAQLSDDQLDDILTRLKRRQTGTVTPVVTPSGAATPASVSFAPIHYPGATDPDQAMILTVGEGEERAAVDIDLQLVRTASVEGRVSILTGVLPSSTQLTLTRHGAHPALSSLTSSMVARQPDSTGGFRFTGVLPGRYRLVARAVMTTPVASPLSSQAASPALSVSGVFWALWDFTVGDQDVSGIALTLQPGLRMSGRIVFDARTLTPPVDLRSVRLRLTDTAGGTSVIPAGSTRLDGSFEIAGVPPGAYIVTATNVDQGWRLRSVVVNGRDILDVPLEIGAAGDVGGAVATFTDRHTELVGTLQTPMNFPAPDYFIVLFPPDRSHWRLGSRRVQITRPGTDGRFTFRDLPEGDYLIAALTDLEPTDLADVSFMERLVPAAAGVKLVEGERRTQDLRIAR